MNTLTNFPLAPLLDRLFAQADAATSTEAAGISHEERTRLMHSKTEYLDFYTRLKDLWLPVTREGDALKTLGADLPETIDLLLLDGAKALYTDVLNLVESRLMPGALIVADNADYSPDYLARVRSPNSGYLSVQFGKDVELSMRLG